MGLQDRRLEQKNLHGCTAPVRSASAEPLPKQRVPGLRCLGLTVLVAGSLLACAKSSGGPAANPSTPPPAPSSATVTDTASPSASPSRPQVPTGPAVSGTAEGQTTPQAVVAAFIDSNAKGQYAASCGFVVPAQQANCPAYLTDATPLALPPVTLGPAYRLGTRAMVVALGQICARNTCAQNPNPRLGLPANDAGFDAAYALAQTRFAIGYAAFTCTQVGPNWYVDLGLKTTP